MEMITIPKGGRPRSQIIDEKVLIEKRKKYTIKELATMYNVSTATINRRLREARNNEKQS